MPRNRLKLFGRYAAAYGAWLLTNALGIGVMIVWRSALLGLFIRARFGPYAIAVFNDVIIILMALAALILMIVAEALFRQSVAKGNMRRVVARIDGGLVVLGVIGFLVYQVAR